MDERADSHEEVRMLHRMIAYVRSEAQRLGLFEVALALDHAAEALATFSPTAMVTGGQGGGDRRRARGH